MLTEPTASELDRHAAHDFALQARTMIDPALELLAADTEAAELFDKLCDFHLARGIDEDPWFKATTPHELSVFGADAAGGQFALSRARTGDSLGVIYVSSEG